MNNVLIAGLLGLVGASIPVGLGAFFIRRKTNAETDDLVTQASDRLIKIYEARDISLERRITAAEDKANSAEQRAIKSEAAELNCRTEMRILQHKFDDLQGQVNLLKGV